MLLCTFFILVSKVKLLAY